MEWLQPVSAFALMLYDIVMHLDRHLVELVSRYDTWVYLILFAIIFAETGLVVTPFLPGDSLLFAVGALAAVPSSAIDITVVTLLLIVAAILGDTLNYKLGQVFGERAFSGQIKLVNPRHLERTKDF